LLKKQTQYHPLIKHNKHKTQKTHHHTHGTSWHNLTTYTWLAIS